MKSLEVLRYSVRAIADVRPTFKDATHRIANILYRESKRGEADLTAANNLGVAQRPQGHRFQGGWKAKHLRYADSPRYRKVCEGGLTNPAVQTLGEALGTMVG